MSLSDKVAMDLVEAIVSLNPDVIKKAGIAKAEALKLTAPEQEKRDEAVRIINSVRGEQDKLEEAKKAHDVRLATIEQGNALLADRETKARAHEAANNKVETALKTKEAAILTKEKEQERIDTNQAATKKAQDNEAQRLKDWAAELAEQDEKWNQAQALVKRK